MLANIDGDTIVYRAACVVEKENPLKQVRMMEYNIDKIINNNINTTQANDYNIYLSGKNNFRDKLAKIVPYKQARKTKARPTHYQAARDYLLDRYNAQIVDGMEADDMLGIMQDKTNIDPFSEVLHTIACHTDKDINMIPGLHYNDQKDHKYFVSHEDANRTYWKQVLIGDWQCDGIPGLKGVGKAKAEKLLKNKNTWEEMEDTVKQYYYDRAYLDKGYYTTELQGNISHTHSKVYEVFSEIKQLVWILREPLDGNEKESS